MLNVLRVLVPVDFSKESDLAMDWAQLVARKQRGATLYLLHVLPPKAEGMGSVGYKAEEELVEKKLNALKKSLPEELLSFSIVEQGKVASVVARICEEKNIDLVVMTTRGRKGLKHFLPESLTEDTVRVAPCPVLVLHHNSKNEPVKA